MDPVSMAAVGAVAGMSAETAGTLAAASTAITALGTAGTMYAQGQADKKRAAIEGEWAERRALEERASAQRAAGQEMRKARLAQSRLTALAGDSAGDQSVMDLWGDIEKEGRYNAAQVTAAGEQKASGMQYQAALDQWGAKTNSRIKTTGAGMTLIGGLLDSGAKYGMAGRYGGNYRGAGYG